MMTLVEESQGIDPQLALGVMGILIARSPQAVAELLKAHGTKLPPAPTKDQLMEALLEKIATHDPRFQQEISAMMVKLVEEASGYDHFDLGSLGSIFGKGSSEAGTTGAASSEETQQAIAAAAGSGGTPMVADPVGAVAMGVGKLADMIGNFREKANIKARAKATMQTGMMQYLQLKEQTKALATRKGTFMTLGIIALVGISLLIVWRSTPSPTPTNTLA